MNQFQLHWILNPLLRTHCIARLKNIDLFSSSDHSVPRGTLDTNLSPLLRAMPMSFSMPPASRRALVFSMFLVMTSCRAQQIAVMVSSDMLLLGVPLVPVLLLLFPPGRRWTRSLMAYLPWGWDELKKEYSLLVMRPVSKLKSLQHNLI